MTQPSSNLWKYLSRLTAIAVLAASCAVLLHGYFLLFEGPSAARDAAPSEDDGPLGSHGRVPPGPWVFGEQPWQVQERLVAATDLGVMLARPVGAVPRRPSPVEGTMLELARRFATKTRMQGEVTVHERDDEGLALRLYSHGGAVLGVRVAVAGPGSWRVIEVMPTTGGVSVAAASLLPWPDGCERLARRADEQGRVLGELMLTSVPPWRLAQRWASDGWRESGETTWKLYRRGKAEVGVWMPGVERDGKKLVLAVRTSQ